MSTKITSLKNLTGDETAEEIFEYFLSCTTYDPVDDADGKDRE